MPTLAQSLQHHDLGHLRILAEHWGIELDAPDAPLALPVLVEQILDRGLIGEIVGALPEEARAALSTLKHNQGRLLWSQFVRRFGEVREMGAGRRDRERPDRQPVSASEVLWYRGLVARAFFDTTRGTEEFAYIPGDLLTLLPPLKPEGRGERPRGAEQTLGRPATRAERAHQILATDRILDHCCTLLAALRIGIDPPLFDPYPAAFVHDVLQLAGLLKPSGIPDVEAARRFLEAPRSQALATIAQAWLTNPTYNDLQKLPHLRPEGEWENDPLGARTFILQLLSKIPREKWWNLSAFIADIRQQHPDFQRPAGDYDTWFIKSVCTGEYLRGFEHWDDVDGALVRYLVTGPMHWLGLMDLAAPSEDVSAAAFRFSKWAEPLLDGRPPAGLAAEDGGVHVRSDGRVSVPLNAPRAVRYQISRFCQWEESTAHEYRYRLTPSSLTRALKQELRIGHLVSLLKHHTDAVPPNILSALRRWAERGTEVRLQQMTVLRLGSPQILQALRSSRAARFLGEPLGPAAVAIKPGAGQKVLEILTEMGYLGEVIGDL